MDKRKVLITSAIIILVLAVAGIVFATVTNSSVKNYAVEVVDDGSNTKTEDKNMSIQSKVVDTNKDKDELTYETTLTNIAQATKDKEIALLVDTSYSMEQNADTYDIKATATDLATNLINNVSGAKVSVVDNTGVRVSETSDISTLTNNINQLTYSNSGTIDKGIEYAYNSLNRNSANDKYVIILTDATDAAKAKLEQLETDDIKVYSILVDITSTEFGTPTTPIPSSGTVYLMNGYNVDTLINDINKIIREITVTNKFNNNILLDSSNGNFNVEILNNDTDGTATLNSDGTITWKVDSISASETAKLKYKLKLNKNQTIATYSLYKDIKTNSETTVKYTKDGAEQTLQGKDTEPTIRICDAYDVVLQAVGRDTTIPAENVKISVTGVDENGNIVVSENGLITDKNGKVTIPKITNLGKIRFTITPDVTGLLGYETTKPVELEVNNKYGASGGELSAVYTEDASLVTTDDTNGKRTVEAKVPIELKKFTIKLNVEDLSDPNAKLEGVSFRLIQPKLNNKFEMGALYGTTNAKGEIEFNATIMSAGEYDYILSQTSDKFGYENVGNTTIKIKFDSNGDVVEKGVYTLYNSNVSAERIDKDQVLVNVKEKCNSSNTFNIKMNLTDENTKAAIEGTVYDIKVINVSGTGNDTVTYTKATDSNGNIEFKAIGADDAFTKIVIHESSTNKSYIAETTDKEIILKRENGIIKDITTGRQYATKDTNNNNGIIINLTSKKKQELNVVRIHVTDKDDMALNLVNVQMELKDVTPNGANNGKILRATSDVDGYANFVLDDPATIEDGTYIFEVKANPMPIGYVTPDVQTIKVVVLNGRISDITDVTNGASVSIIQNPTVLVDNLEKTVSNVAYADFAMEPDANTTAYLKIVLTDNDSGTPVENGKYEVSMERDGAQIANAGSTGKYTNKDGIAKMSIPGLDAKPVIITIAQVYDSTRQNGYKTDKNIYQITVHKDSDGNVVIDNTQLSDGTEFPAGITATYEDGNGDSIYDTVVFNHKNLVLNPGDVILDFTVLKYDYVTKEPDQQQNLVMWSDDFKIYDETTKNYESFGESNVYNPFTTGVVGSNGTPGQTQVKLKPTNLPTVEDVNKDGFPTGGAILHIGEYDETTKGIAQGTEYQIQINFTYSKETGTYKYSGYSNLSNWYLLKDFHHSTSLNSSEGYEETAILELWSNYGKTANFAIDLSKYAKDGTELVGAKYQIKAVLPTGKFVEITTDVLNGKDTVEIPNLFVKDGTIITITEEEAPIGYQVDKEGASFIINSVDANTGTASISEYGVASEKVKLDGSTVQQQEDGSYKFIQNIKLTDLEMDNLKFGIHTKDKETNADTKGNTYLVEASSGSAKITGATGEDGKLNLLIGSEKVNDYVEYTISQKIEDGTSVAQYYKRLEEDIHIKVYFDANGNIETVDPNDNYNTLNSTDPNYNKTWFIDEVNDGNRLGITILQQRESPLKVNVKTKDAFTGNIVNDVANFEITPTEQLTGKGSSYVEVGYVDPNKTVTYNLKTTTEENYVTPVEQQFAVTYDADGNVNDVKVVGNSSILSVEKDTSETHTINITLTIEPAVPFEIHNTDFYTNDNLANGKFIIEREDNVISNEKTTNSEGNTVVYDGDFGTGTSTNNRTYIYKVKQTEAKYGYATIDEFNIAVEYDSNRNIVSARVSTTTDSTDKLVTVTAKTNTGLNGNNKGIVSLEIKNLPAFRINLDNYDRPDYNNGTLTSLAGAEYEITGDNGTSTKAIKTTTDTLPILIGKNPINGAVTYTVKEIKPEINHQTIEKDITISMEFSDGKVVDNTIRISDNENTPYASVSAVTPKVNNEDNHAINLNIRNNKLIQVNVHKINESNNPISNVKFSIEGKNKANDEVVFTQEVTTLEGLGAFRLNKALNNTTIVYTIKEVKNTAGYEYIPENLSLEITYDNDGKIAKDTSNNYQVKLTPDVSWAKITNIEEYAIDMNVTNERIKEIGVNLNTIDKYDDAKKAEQAEIKAYFTTDNVTFNEDTNHSATLITGRTDENGNPEYSHGQDYKTLGRAENINKNEINGMQTATLVLKEIKTPKTYWDTINNVSKDNIYMNWGYYGVSSARIDLTFTDEGKIATANLVGDSVGTTPLGKCLDGQYIEVTIDPTNPYALNVDLRYYPMLEMTINAESDDTYERATDKNDNDLIGTYKIKTQHYNDIVSITNSVNTNLRNGLIKAGYIGNSTLGGIVPTALREDSKILNTKTNVYEANNYGLWPGEQLDEKNSVDVSSGGRIRYVYIYEPNDEQKSEPDDNYPGYTQLKYQQNGQQDNSPMYMSYNQALMGAIQVKYNEKGEIIEALILKDKGANSDNRDENEDKSEYLTVTISDNKHGIIVKSQYKRTTTIEAKVTDNVTGAELKDIELSPFLGNTPNTNRNYKYDTYGRRNLANGENKWTYWGGNDANGSNQYVIGTKYNNSTLYNGYSAIGSVKLELHYDKYGYVDKDASKVISKNANGDPNAVIEKVDKDKVYINIIANRKVDIQIDKKDKFDSTKKINDVRYSITSTKYDLGAANETQTNLRKEIEQGKRQSIGLMHKGETVTYTIAETFTPEGYITMNDFDMSVTYNKEGVITKIVLEDGTKLYDSLGIHTSSNIPIKLISVAPKYTGLKPQNVTDLRFELTNTPKFNTNITTKDQFYKDETISGVTYTIEDITHNISATGNPTTDDNGNINTYVGTVYPNEKVKYKIAQTNIANGYYAKNSDIEIEVEYDSLGYVTDYVVTKGKDAQSEIEVQSGKRGLDITIYNKPRDVKIGIEKYDQLTNQKLENVGFDITRQEVNTSTKSTYNEQTEANGDITEIVDSFDAEKEILYTISETKQLDAYRRIEDVVIRVKYAADGSIDYYNVDSNPSNVKITVANGKFETLANKDKVHIKVEIPNDDTYDLIVRDENKDINKLGVEGTQYNISINGNQIDKVEKTNGDGYTKVINRKENGDITIKVSEQEIGTGYRENTENTAELVFAKGVSTYSLELDETSVTKKGYTLISGPTDVYDTNYKDGKEYEIGLTTSTSIFVDVYEDTGKIVYKFKNDTKQMLNISKIDSITGQPLEGAEFEVEAQEVDSFGNLQGTATTIATNVRTDKDGLATVDIGARPESKKIKYTFKETKAPDGYVAIENVSVIYTYNSDEKISGNENTSKRIKGGSSWYDVNVSIKNGDLNTYSVKVISVDSRKGSTATGMSNNRINDSIFDVSITDSTGKTLAETKDTKTADGLDSFGYTEKGIIRLENLTAEGTISVNVAQKEFVEGFVQGANQTAGTVTFENNYIRTSPTAEAEVSLTNLQENGFIDSYIDTNENEIVIKVYNDPQMRLNLHKQDIDTEEPIEGATFTITSEIDGKNQVATVPTSLNVTSNGTDKNGNEDVIIGAPEYGKTVIYTIHENDLKQYKEIDDTKIKVTYDAYGKITLWEVLGDESYVQVKEEVLRNRGAFDWTNYTDEELSNILGQVDAEGNSIAEMVQTAGSRRLNTLINNKAEDKVVPYTIIVEAQDEMKMPVSGIDIDLTLKQGKGGNPVFPTKTTDNNGQTSYQANGSDRLEINIVPTNTQNYTFNTSLTTILHKNTNTGEIKTLQNNNIYPEIDNVNHIIKLVILCETPNNKFNLALYKMDKATNSTIANNPATFTVTKEEALADGSVIEKTIATNKVTNASGIINLQGLNIPTDTGTYKYKIYEDIAPTGYIKLEDPLEISITFDLDSLGNKIITNVTTSDKNKAYVSKSADKGIILCINNDEEVLADKYMINAFKVDKDSDEKLNGAIFKVKLPDSKGTTVITESGENTPNKGQLDYCYVEQDKDYKVRLKEMARPEVADVKAAQAANKAYTHEYIFQEISAPDGYELDRTPITLTLTFDIKTDSNGAETVIITNAVSSDTRLVVKDIQEDRISIDIQNTKENKLAGAYRVTYDGNKTEIVNNMPADQAKLTGVDLSLDSKVPSISGFKFIGWNTSADGSGTTYQPGDIYSDEADITLYAQWTIANYTITYNANEPKDIQTQAPVGTATNIPANQTKTHGTDIILDDDGVDPTITGLESYYEFTGWNTSADGTGTAYAPGNTCTEEADITLYAQWNYIINYQANVPVDANGTPVGTANDIPQTEKVSVQKDATIDDLTTYTNAPTLDKYEFKGWNTSADGTGTWYQPNDSYTERKGIDLYAIWELAGKLYLKTTEYEIGENDKTIYESGDKYIAKIKPEFALNKKGTNKQEGTTVKEFISNIETNATSIEIQDLNGKVLTDTDIIGTGAQLYLSKGSESIQLGISVIGDLNGDGKIKITDLSEILKVYGKAKKDKTGDTAKKYFTDNYPSVDLNIDGELMYKSSDLNDDGIGATINDLSTIQLIYSLSRGGNPDDIKTGDIDKTKLWRGGNII